MDASETTGPALVRPDHVGAAETSGAFARILLGGDATAAAAYFSTTAKLLTPDGTELSGRDAIAELLTQLIAPDQQLQILAGRTTATDTVALCTQYWTRTSRSLPSEGFESHSTARLMLTRTEQRWQIVIAAPWG